MHMSLKMGYVATLSHGNRQPLQGTPSMIPICSPLHPTLEGLWCQGDDIWRQEQPLLLWLLTSPTLDPSVKPSLDKGVATPKSPSGETRTCIRSRTGQTCPNSLLLRMGFFQGSIFMNQADGKHCSPLQQNGHQRNLWRWHSLGFCKTLISSEHLWIILRVLYSDSLVLRPY